MMMTQKERLAALEAEGEAHTREHELTERVWLAKLDAIDARLRGIEQFIRNAPDREDDGYVGWRLHRRDLVIMSGSVGMTSFIWMLVDLGLRFM